MGSYVPATAQERRRMLRTLGLSSVEELFLAVPERVRVGALDLPEGRSEMETFLHLRALSRKNHVFGSIFRGAGAYNHYIPAIVGTVTSKEEFLTSYTPYQAEISQGTLQSIFEYQTQICELTGMDVSNASVYDGATAAAEAVLMCEERRRTGAVVSGAAHPQALETIRTYAESREVPVVTIACPRHVTGPDALREALEANPQTACVFVQSPNFFGAIEDVASLAEVTHGAGAQLVMSANPISLGLLESPGELGADIAVGEGQPLGLSLSFGGPYLGYLACRERLMRRLPGRIVGETSDDAGRRAYVLTLQAREQHIRREKASSNICSNEALCALAASVYLAALGPRGLRQVAASSTAHAHYLAGQLAALGLRTTLDAPFFNEFPTSCPIDANVLVDALADRDILAGLPVGDEIVWCCTELNAKAQIDGLVDAIREVIAR